MKCAACNHRDTKVVDSRLSSNGMSIRRRRECLKCSFRFSTLEEVEILDLTIVKRNGHREAYSREKLDMGVRKALHKRPVTAERFKELIGSIERDLQKMRKSEITSSAIGEVIMNRLRGFDKVAYIRFASVYRAFEDVKTFQKALEHLASGARRPKKKRR